MELVDQDTDTFTVKFSVDQVLSRLTPDFEDDLLYNLNILQENVAAALVFESTATLDQYLTTVHVQWEILPVGTVDEVLRKMLLGKPPISSEQQGVMRERLGVMARLNPKNYIAGTTGFLRYFGAKFADDFVAFENLQYGNAIYVMFQQWETLCQRSRIDLLKGPREGFERIIHSEGWIKRLESSLKHYRENQQRRDGTYSPAKS